MIAAATSAVAHPLALPTVPAQVRGCAGSVPHSTSYSIGYVKGRRLQAAFRPAAALLRGLPYAWRTAFVVPRRFTPTTPPHMPDTPSPTTGKNQAPPARTRSTPGPVVKFRVRITQGDATAIGPGKMAQREATESTASIPAAPKPLGMSYRRAWFLL